MNEQQLIESKVYFSNMLLIILKYLELMFRYISINHNYYKIKNFSDEVFNYRQENNILGEHDVIYIDNIKKLRNIFDQFLNSY